MQALAEHNNGFRYFLTVIDVFSKTAFVRVLKNNFSTLNYEVGGAFESVLKESGVPRKLKTDEGK